jgi:hypothetical protein
LVIPRALPAAIHKMAAAKQISAALKVTTFAFFVILVSIPDTQATRIAGLP